MGLVLTLFILIYLCCLGFALLSFAFAWVEAANRQPALLSGRFSAAGLGLALKLVALESAALFLTTLLHPCGWFKPRYDTSDEGRETPVLFLHGLFQSRACWLPLRWGLGRRGRRRLYALPLPPWREIDALADEVGRVVDKLRVELGAEKVCLVGHSMGGLVARNYLQLRGGADKVERCILIATPNHGSKLAPLALTELGLSAFPGSEFLTQLREAPLPPVRLVNIYSRHDNIVLPPENARLEGAENLELHGIGHTSLLVHPEVFEHLAQLLGPEAP